MFIEEQKKKIIFNMLYHQVSRENSKLIIFDRQNNPLGILAEYKNEGIAEFIMEEIAEVLDICNMNGIFCLYKFPKEEEIEKEIGSGSEKI
jgi:hypothetical protein